MANFFLRGIDADVFTQARAWCLAEDRRLVDLICHLLREWLKSSTTKKEKK